MKTKEEIYLDEVKRCTEQLGEKFGKIVMSDAIRKFTLNCLMKMEDQFRQPIVIKSLLADLPENRPLYKDSGLWQMRSDDMEEVIIQQGINESESNFIERCKASNVL